MEYIKAWNYRLLEGMIDCSDVASLSAEEYYEKLINDSNFESILGKYRAKKE